MNKKGNVSKDKESFRMRQVFKISRARMEYINKTVYTDGNDSSTSVQSIRVTCRKSPTKMAATCKGDHANALKRALAKLTRKCNCGAKFHKANNTGLLYF